MGCLFHDEKIAGEDLKDILFKLEEHQPEYEQKYTLSKLLDIFRDVCNGVSFSHSKGVIHRDLKPENIFVGDFGEVLVLDWGLVRELKHNAESMEKEGPSEPAKDQFDSSVNIDIDDSKTPDLTLDGFVSGTPFYMSPEQAKAENNLIDHRSDIYTLRVILYQILSMRLPFQGEDIHGTLNLVALGDFIPPRKIAPQRKIPAELEAICLKAMAYNREDRYQKVEDLVADIYNYQDSFPVTAMHYSWASRFWKLCRRHPVISTSVAAVLDRLALYQEIAPNFLDEEQLKKADNLRQIIRGDGKLQVSSSPENAFISENHSAIKKHGFWAPPGSFPNDTSVYCVKDLGGNVREWTNSKFHEGSPFFQIKGASSSTTRRFLYCAYSSDTPVVPSDVGFRYVFPIPVGKRISDSFLKL